MTNTNYLHSELTGKILKANDFELNTFLKGLIDSLLQFKTNVDNIKKGASNIKSALQSAKTLLNGVLSSVNLLDNLFIGPVSRIERGCYLSRKHATTSHFSLPDTPRSFYFLSPV